MKLYIRLKNGAPFEHPITEHNLLQSFPHIDLNNLPEYISIFEKTDPHITKVYETADLIYSVENNVVKERWSIRSMTDQEKKEKQDLVKKLWISLHPNSQCVFDEETCSFVPPISYPSDGRTYEWSDETSSWIEIIPD